MDASHDQFVITRIVKHPELVYNDVMKQESVKHVPYFAKDAAS